MLDLVIISATTLLICILTLWVISIAIGKVSFVDSFWGASFAVVSWTMFLSGTVSGTAQIVVLLMVTLWGLRLALHLIFRFLKEGEDKRYIHMLGSRSGLSRHMFSLFIVFGFQALLILIISSPIAALFSKPATPLSDLAYVGVSIWAVGMFFEVVGDWQLSRFKADPLNKGRVLDTGLWAWTRHPNYFGDACVWWGIWLVGHDLTLIYAPITISFLLMKWSGVPLLEATIEKRRPGYAEYIMKTSSFFPFPPRGK